MQSDRPKPHGTGALPGTGRKPLPARSGLQGRQERRRANRGRPSARTAALTAVRRRRVRNVAVAAIGALVLAGAILLAVSHSTAKGDTKAQAFSLPRLGEPGYVSLSSLRGKPLVVNFFASWCPNCAHELPTFARDARLLRGKVEFVEVDTLETGNGLAFAKQFGLFSAVTAVARDVGGSNGDGLYQALGGTGSMPLTAFYNSRGRVITTQVGAFDNASLASALQQFYGVKVPTATS
ncbi:MAG: TlpA disulfide reductase family protein [Acidimicrobiales bacterium]